MKKVCNGEFFFYKRVDSKYVGSFFILKCKSCGFEKRRKNCGYDVLCKEKIEV